MYLVSASIRLNVVENPVARDWRSQLTPSSRTALKCGSEAEYSLTRLRQYDANSPPTEETTSSKRLTVSFDGVDLRRISKATALTLES